MERKQNHGFESAAEIIKSLDLKFDENFEQRKEDFMSEWKNAAGEKLAVYSEPKKLTEDGILMIICKNSTVANELFNKRIKINALLKEKSKKYDVVFKYIKISY